ncbi:family 78 glycoside hydrolase catalytic domain [Paenarthrobacter ilicis]|uniref:family 78 glycoside hydrolase catalytic domain n=1 Tax=Paenarthrobacter ilicis TaxID=43665 RepID=UPI0028D6ACCC|nr:family 78 glycoside hydrolase catalytic domain [Paenarthrobacter ilicis]
MTDPFFAPSPQDSLRDAVWISPAEEHPAKPGGRPAYWLRGRFTWTREDGRTIIHATAHGIYELFVNDHRVGDHELTPGFTSYRRRLQVQSWDVTDLLIHGDNTVSALISDGWFRGRHGFERRADGFGAETAFLASALTARRTLFTTQPTWESRESHIIRADLMDGQGVDFRLPSTPGDTRTPGGWSPVIPRSGGLYENRARFVRHMAPPVRRIEELPPVCLTFPAPNRTVVDFGQNINGWIRLKELGPAGTSMTLLHGEFLDQAGLVSTDHLQAFDFATKTLLPAGQLDVVTSAGREGDVFEPRHTTHGFRYVQVEGNSVPLTAEAITAVVVHTDLKSTGTFECSDPRLNALHDAIRWSFRGNACDVPTDCPQRERSGFTGDWQVFVDTAALMFDVSGFSAKWLQDLAADQWPDGRVPTIVPNPAGNGPSGNFFEDLATGSAGWGDAAVFVPWSLWRAYGEKQVLSDAFPSMCSWVDYAAGAAASGRHPQRAAARPAPLAHERYVWDTGFHFGEWLEPDTPPNPDPSRDHGIVATAYLHRSALLLSKAATVLGASGAAAHYGSLATNVRTAWQAEYLDAGGRLREESQGHYVRALAFGLVPDGLAPLTAGRLVELIRANGNRLGTGFLATGLLLPTLAHHGYLNVAYDLLLNAGSPSWLGMLDAGATTMWEWWDGVSGGEARGSLNHYSKGAVASFFYTHIAGIRQPEHSAAYRAVTIAPRPGGGITSASAAVETVRGRISSAWTLDGDLFALHVGIPEGVTAVVDLPDGSSHAMPAGAHDFRTVLSTQRR